MAKVKTTTKGRPQGRISQKNNNKQWIKKLIEMERDSASTTTDDKEDSNFGSHNDHNETWDDCASFDSLSMDDLTIPSDLMIDDMMMTVMMSEDKNTADDDEGWEMVSDMCCSSIQSITESTQEKGIRTALPIQNKKNDDENRTMGKPLLSMIIDPTTTNDATKGRKRGPRRKKKKKG